MTVVVEQEKKRADWTEDEGQQRIRELCAKIKNNAQFAKILRNAKAESRHALYEMFAPNVCFRPTPWLLMKLRVFD